MPKTPTPTVSRQQLRSVDRELLVAMRDGEELGINELTQLLGVTPTAVRQRIERMLDRGLVKREKVVAGRGRPTYRYRLSRFGRQFVSADPTDLAEALWQTIVSIDDEAQRQSLLHSVASNLGQRYAESINQAGDLHDRLDHVSKVLATQQINSRVQIAEGDLPVLDIQSCPYPDLNEASDDRAMCKLEEKMLSEALGQPVQLSSCRLDGDDCCQFSPQPISPSPAPTTEPLTDPQT